MSKSKLTKMTNLDPTLRKAKETFAVRYFDWAVAQAKNETQANFPNLREIEAPSVFQFLEFCEENPPDVTERILDVLVRAGHKYAMALTKNALTAAELDLLRAYSTNGIEKGNTGVVTGLQSQRYMRSMQTTFAQNVSQTDRDTIIESIGVAFSSLEGLCRRDVGSLEHVQRLGGWYVTTHFAVLLAGPAKLAYEHRVSPFPYGEGTVLFYLGGSEKPSHGLSILSWLGIWPVTNWMSLPKGSPEQIGTKVAEIAKVFLTGVPKLLQGVEAPVHH